MPISNLPLHGNGMRAFRTSPPKLLRFADITEFSLPCGSKRHLNPMVDCLDGDRAAWPIDTEPPAVLTNAPGRLHRT